MQFFSKEFSDKNSASVVSSEMTDFFFKLQDTTSPVYVYSYPVVGILVVGITLGMSHWIPLPMFNVQLGCEQAIHMDSVLVM